MTNSMNSRIKPEIRLKRFIRPKKLKVFFEKATALLPENSLLCAYIEDTPVFCADPSIYPFEKTIFTAVVNDANENLRIGVSLQNFYDLSEKEITQIKAVLEFTSYSISAHIESEKARRLLGEETLSKYRELSILHRSIVELNNSLKLKDVIKALIKECKSSNIPAEMGAVYLPEEHGFTVFDSFGTDSAETFEELIGCSLFTDIITSLHGEILNDAKQDHRCENKLCGNIKSILIMPIPSPHLCEGVLVLTSKHANAFNAAHLKHVYTLASVAGISISNAYNFESIRVLMDALLKALAEAIDARDPFTAGHSERVAHLAVSFARLISQEDDHFNKTEFTDEQLREIFYSGILHDIGKIGIKEYVLTKKTRLPKAILDIIGMRMKLFGIHHHKDWEEDYNRVKQINISLSPEQDDLDFIHNISEIKFNINGANIQLLQPEEQKSLLIQKGNLTPEERCEIERHPAESKRILEHIPFHEDLAQLLTIICQHHERLDGSGYPSGIKGDEILIQSQILAIVDIYDAITQERHYKPAKPQTRALQILEQEAAEGKLNKHLVKFFIDNILEILKGSKSIDLDRPVSPRFCKIPRNNLN